MDTIALEPLHRFHSYCARFPTGIVEAALQQYTKNGESVFDPFCGSGTTLVAALAHGRSAVGADIDVLAGMLSEVKCHPKTSDDYQAWRSGFFDRIKRDFSRIAASWPAASSPRPGDAWTVGTLHLLLPSFPELRYWFPPQLIAALATIANAAREQADVHFEKIALVSLSASIVSKWPTTLSYAMDIDHTRPHRRMQRFTLDRILAMYSARLDRTVACLGELHRIYTDAGITNDIHRRVTLRYPHDVRQDISGLEPESQSLVVTSPPYFNAVDYPRAHRLATCWMNGFAPTELVSRRNYVGLRHAPGLDCDTWFKEHPTVRRLISRVVSDDDGLTRRLCAFYDDLRLVLKQVWTALKPDGHAVFVIANNVIKGKRIASHRILARLAEDIGFIEVSNTARQIESMRRRFPVGPFGFDGPMTHEYLVTLRKPGRRRRRMEAAHG